MQIPGQVQRLLFLQRGDTSCAVVSCHMGVEERERERDRPSGQHASASACTLDKRGHSIYMDLRYLLGEIDR